jgi:hypothetical protein
MGREAKDEVKHNLRILFDICKWILDAVIIDHELVPPLCEKPSSKRQEGWEGQYVVSPWLFLDIDMMCQK